MAELIEKSKVDKKGGFQKKSSRESAEKLKADRSKS
jgi:hypothetical protein